MALSQKTTPLNDTVTQTQRDSLRVFSSVAAIGAWGLLLIYALAYFLSSDARYIQLIGADLVLSILLTLTWILQRQKLHYQAIWILFSATILVVGVVQFIVQGLGVVVSIAFPLIFISIAWQIVPRRPAWLITGVVIVSGALFFVLDAYLAPGGRLPISILMQEIISVLAGVVFFISLINGIRTHEFGSVGAQIRTAFFLVAMAPVLITAAPGMMSTINLQTRQTDGNLTQAAQELSRQLDNQIESVIQNLEEDAVRPSVVIFMSEPSQSSNLLDPLKSRYPNLLSLGLLNKSGKNLLDTERGLIGKNESASPYFQEALKNPGETFVSNVVLDPQSGKSVFFISKTIFDDLGNPIGVTRLKIDAILLQKTVMDAKNSLGDGFTAAIVDNANIILAHSASSSLRTQLLVMPTAEKVSSLQREGRLPPAPTDAGLSDLEQKLTFGGTADIFGSKITPDTLFTYGLFGGDTVSFVTMDTRHWKVLVALNNSQFFAPIFSQIAASLIILVVALSAVAFGANLITGLLVAPIKQLSEAAQALGRRQFDYPSRMERKDEFGRLSIIIEETSKLLQESVLSLETRVSQRTAELQAVSQSNARRAVQLEAIAQIARSVTGLNDPEQLLPEITKQISQAFGYYHTGIFLIDEQGEYAVLRAANSAGGQRMLKRSHHLKVGREGIVGFVSNTGRPRITMDVGSDATYFNNPDLPNTHSEIALPLKIGEKIIGVLDVQTTETEAFNEEDLKTLSLLSDQISIAIENARLFEETRLALRQIQEIYAEASGTGWQSLLGESSTRGYRYVKGNLEPLFQAEKTPAHSGEYPLEIPINIRGEHLGSLKIRQPGHSHPLSTNEVHMYQAIVERLTFALENARLFAEARKRANFEKLASAASAKISASVRYETILRTAAEEISRILDGSDVLIQIQPQDQEAEPANPNSRVNYE